MMGAVGTWYTYVDVIFPYSYTIFNYTYIYWRTYILFIRETIWSIAMLRIDLYNMIKYTSLIDTYTVSQRSLNTQRLLKCNG
jgi:hypothetical protein